MQANTIEAVPASGPGALPGFRFVCQCGTEATFSLLTLTQEFAADHAAFHERYGAVR